MKELIFFELAILTLQQGLLLLHMFYFHWELTFAKTRPEPILKIIFS